MQKGRIDRLTPGSDRVASVLESFDNAIRVNVLSLLTCE